MRKKQHIRFIAIKQTIIMIEDIKRGNLVKKIRALKKEREELRKLKDLESFMFPLVDA